MNQSLTDHHLLNASNALLRLHENGYKGGRALKIAGEVVDELTTALTTMEAASEPRWYPWLTYKCDPHATLEYVGAHIAELLVCVPEHIRDELKSDTAISMLTSTWIVMQEAWHQYQQDIAQEAA